MIEFLAAYWLWILLIGGFVLMHRGGGCGSHGAGHRGHAGNGGHRNRPVADDRGLGEGGRVGADRSAEPKGGAGTPSHRHAA
jgi:hypothetical protein